MQYNIEALVRLGILQIQSAYGYNKQPFVINDTNEYTAPAGEIFYAYKAIDGDVEIDGIKNLQGSGVAGLSNVIIKEGDILQFPSTSIKLVSGTFIVYPVQKIDNLLP